jgi:hypothetical protein
MAAVFTVPAADHAEVKAMLAELERGPAKGHRAKPEPAGSAHDDHPAKKEPMPIKALRDH